MIEKVKSELLLTQCEKHTTIRLNMNRKIKKLILVFIIFLFGCSEKTPEMNFEDRWIEDIKTAQSALMTNPSNLDAVRLRADAYYELKKGKKALEDYSQLIESDKDNSELYLRRGVSFHSLGEYEEALSDFNRSIDLNPGNAKGYHRRADVLSALNKYEDSLADFTKTISMAPDEAGSYTCRGRLFNKRNEKEKALLEFNRAIKMAPDSFYARYQRGMFYYGQDDYELAINDLKAMESIEPDFLSYEYRSWAYVSMIKAHYRLREYSKTVLYAVKLMGTVRRIIELNKKIREAEATEA